MDTWKQVDSEKGWQSEPPPTTLAGSMSRIRPLHPFVSAFDGNKSARLAGVGETPSLTLLRPRMERLTRCLGQRERFLNFFFLPLIVHRASIGMCL